MKRSGPVVVAGLIIVGLFIVGAFYLGREIVQLYEGLDARFVALSLLVLLSVLILAGGLRRAGAGKERHYRLRQMAEVYASYLRCARDPAAISGNAARELALWASPGVLRAIDARPPEDCKPDALRDWLLYLLREMRQDLGQSNIQLKLGRLVDALMTDASNGGNGCKLS